MGVPPTITGVLLLAAGLLLLLGGGHFLVDAASRLARALGVSPLLIGLTIVAFGTSAPELVVNLAAAWSGRGEISFGNVIGSNLANLGLILGIAALLRPLTIQGTIIVREIPMMLLATAVAAAMALDGTLRSEPAEFDRSDGLCLLLLFTVFLYYTAAEVIRKRPEDPFLHQAGEIRSPREPRQILRHLAMIAGGLLALAAGGHLTVEAAAGLARALGVAEVVIGLSAVAVGTSLPELVTSLIAGLRGESDIAVGNIVGSNIFNLLFILGLSASLRPVPVPAGGIADIAALMILSTLLLPMAITGRKRLVRPEGLFLLSLWIGYSTWRLWPAAGG